MKPRHTLVAFFLIGLVGAAVPDDKTLPDGQVVNRSTPNGVAFGLWGKQPTFPAPTLVVLSATIDESLGEAYFRQCGNQLAEAGWLLVSLDLPGHGMDHRDGEPAGLAAWRYRADRNEDFVAPFTSRVRRVLDHLIDAGYTNPEKIAACGTSRGGFLALHAAVVEPRIRAVAAFAPVTNLMALREFDGATNNALVSTLSLQARADKLAGRSLWLIIGDRDTRVGTDDCIEFARTVTAASLAQEKAADVTLIVQPEPKGHTTPKGAPEKAAAWIQERLR